MNDTNYFTWFAANGTVIDFRLPTYLMRAAEGLGAVRLGRQVQRAPYQHGATVVDTRMAPREISLQMRIFADSEAALFNRRRTLLQAFNPLSGVGRLQWLQPNGQIFEIQALPDEAPIFLNEGGLPNTQAVLIHLLGPDPLWYNPATTQEAFQTFTGGQDWEKSVNLVNLNPFFTYGEYAWRKASTGAVTEHANEITRGVSHQGHYSLHIHIEGGESGSQRWRWVADDAGEHMNFPVMGGGRVSARCKVRVDTLDGSSDARMFIDFLDEGNSFLANSIVAQGVTTGGEFVSLTNISVLVPAGAVSARLGVGVRCDLTGEVVDAYFDSVGFVNQSAFSEDEVSLTGGEEFALVQNVDEFDGGQEFGVVAGIKEATNEGDVPAPFTVTFNGPALNPTIVNVTLGKRMRVERELESGESIRIQTGFGSKSVTLTAADGTESNVIHLLSQGSEFWLLAVGENTLSYEEDSGLGGIGDMELTFTDWFTGA